MPVITLPPRQNTMQSILSGLASYLASKGQMRQEEELRQRQEQQRQQELAQRAITAGYEAGGGEYGTGLMRQLLSAIPNVNVTGQGVLPQSPELLQKAEELRQRMRLAEAEEARRQEEYKLNAKAVGQNIANAIAEEKRRQEEYERGVEGRKIQREALTPQKEPMMWGMIRVETRTPEERAARYLEGKTIAGEQIPQELINKQLGFEDLDTTLKKLQIAKTNLDLQNAQEGIPLNDITNAKQLADMFKQSVSIPLRVELTEGLKLQDLIPRITQDANIALSKQVDDFLKTVPEKNKELVRQYIELDRGLFTPEISDFQGYIKEMTPEQIKELSSRFSFADSPVRQARVKSTATQMEWLRKIKRDDAIKEYQIKLADFTKKRLEIEQMQDRRQAATAAANLYNDMVKTLQSAYSALGMAFTDPQINEFYTQYQSLLDSVKSLVPQQQIATQQEGMALPPMIPSGVGQYVRPTSTGNVGGADRIDTQPKPPPQLSEANAINTMNQKLKSFYSLQNKMAQYVQQAEEFAMKSGVYPSSVNLRKQFIGGDTDFVIETKSMTEKTTNPKKINEYKQKFYQSLDRILKPQWDSIRSDINSFRDRYSTVYPSIGTDMVGEYKPLATDVEPTIISVIPFKDKASPVSEKQSQELVKKYGLERFGFKKISPAAAEQISKWKTIGETVMSYPQYATTPIAKWVASHPESFAYATGIIEAKRDLEGKSYYGKDLKSQEIKKLIEEISKLIRERYGVTTWTAGGKDIRPDLINLIVNGQVNR